MNFFSSQGDKLCRKSGYPVKSRVVVWFLLLFSSGCTLSDARTGVRWTTHHPNNVYPGDHLLSSVALKDYLVLLDV